MSEGKTTIELRDPLIGRKIGEYWIDSAIGKGGMATVYSAVRDQDESLVALKIISPEFSASPEFLTRFRREAKLMARLNHAHILPIYHFDTLGEITYIVMKLVGGGSLETILKAGVLSIEVALPLIDQIASALDYAHSLGVIHRDLKPANILLDEMGQLYLTDFGIAKWKEETTGITVAGSVVGTPAYMAPEQWRTEAVDARTDVYAMGVLVFRMFAGRTPYIAATPFSLMYKHLDEPPPPLSAYTTKLPPVVDLVLQRALAKLPERRYPSAGELAFALKEAIFNNNAVGTDDEELETMDISAVNDPTTALREQRIMYNSIDAGARSLLARAREAVREHAGNVHILAQPVIHYVDELREHVKRSIGQDSPYKALESYDLQDHRLFFGRETAIDAMLARTPFAKLTILHAESGAGKTSLIRAGLMPRLLAGGFLPLYVAVRRSLPHESIKQVLHPDTKLQEGSLRTYLKTLAQVVGQNREFFIFIDQFETFFTDVFTDTQRTEFVQELAEVLDDSTLNVRLTLAMRTEYFGLVASFQPTIPKPFQYEFLLRDLTLEEGKRALIGPVIGQGLEYEDGLVDMILDDLKDEDDKIAPPQLQLVGTALIEKLGEGQTVIQQTDYEAAGRAKGVLQNYLDRLLEKLPTVDRRPARVILESLVRADQTRDVRSADSLRHELEALSIPITNFDRILLALRENHVLRIVDTNDGLAYELVHDYLALQVQLDPETTTRKAAQELLMRRVEDYTTYGSLLTRQELDVIKTQQARLYLTEQAKALITHTNRMFRRQHLLTIGLTSAAILGIIGILAIGLLATLRENQNRQERLDDARRAQITLDAQVNTTLRTESLRLADLSQQQSSIDPIASLNLALLSLTPLDRPYVIEAEIALWQAVQHLHEKVYLPSDGAVWNSDATQLLTWGSDGVNVWADPIGKSTAVSLTPSIEQATTATFSPDGNLIATGDEQGNIIIFENLQPVVQAELGGQVMGISWDITGSRFLAWTDSFTRIWATDGTLMGQLDGIYPTWSPNGQQVAAFTGLNALDNMIYVWKEGNTQALRGHVNSVNGIAWSSDNRHLLSWSDDFKAIIWDTETATIQQEFVHADASIDTGEDFGKYAVEVAQWSPDEQYVLTVRFDGTMTLWDGSSGEALWQISDNAITGAVWNPSGDKILTYGRPEAVAIWDLTGNRLTLPINGLLDNELVLDTVIDARWSFSQSYVIAKVNHFERPTEKLTGKGMVWDGTSLQPVAELLGHTVPIQTMTINQEETLILTSGHAEAARIWSLNSPTETQRFISESIVWEALWSPDYNRIASSHADGKVYIWNVTNGDPVLLLDQHTRDVHELAWHNNYLATGGDDGLALIWETTSGQIVSTLAHQGAIMSMKWNNDGTRLLTGSDDGQIRIWDVFSGQETWSIQQSEIGKAVGSVQWSQDETHILAASDDGFVKVWEVNTGELILDIQASDISTFGVAWNEAETKILAWGNPHNGKKVHVYDAKTGEELLSVVEGLFGWAVSASWSPNESLLLTTTNTGQVQLWDANTGIPIREFIGHTDNVTGTVWSQNGKRILTQSVDGTARVWDVETGKEIFRLQNGAMEDGSFARVNAVSWNFDETLILTGSHDGTIRLWQSWPELSLLIDYAENLVTRPLTLEQRQLFFLP